MTSETLLGLDLGTSSVKAVVTDLQGRTLAQATQPYGVRSPEPGWAESDPQEWWDRTVAAAREAVVAAVSAGAREPSAIGLSGQMHGVVLADASARPRGPRFCGPIPARSRSSARSRTFRRRCVPASRTQRSPDSRGQS